MPSLLMQHFHKGYLLISTQPTFSTGHGAQSVDYCYGFSSRTYLRPLLRLKICQFRFSAVL